MNTPKSNTVYLITGANRGIGLGLVKILLSRPSNTVVGTVRNDETAYELQKLSSAFSKGENSHIETFVLDLSTAVSPSVTRDRFLSALPQIKSIDVLVCSAGHVSSLVPVLDITPEDSRKHFEINTIGNITTFQAFWPFMKKSPTEMEANAPKFISISSSLGSIGDIDPVPAGAYGASKAALNWITKRLHFELEQDGLVSVAIHPGWVQTEMGEFAAKAWGYPGKPPLTLDQSVEGVIEQIDKANRENMSGKFISYDGTSLQW